MTKRNQSIISVFNEAIRDMRVVAKTSCDLGRLQVHFIRAVNIARNREELVRALFVFLKVAKIQDLQQLQDFRRSYVMVRWANKYNGHAPDDRYNDDPFKQFDKEVKRRHRELMPLNSLFASPRVREGAAA